MMVREFWDHVTAYAVGRAQKNIIQSIIFANFKAICTYFNSSE